MEGLLEKEITLPEAISDQGNKNREQKHKKQWRFLNDRGRCPQGWRLDLTKSEFWGSEQQQKALARATKVALWRSDQ